MKKMKKIIKQCIGIDVSQNAIDVTFGVYAIDQAIGLVESKKFPNTPKGFERFLTWSLKHADRSLPLYFVMEATGIYHELLACFLYDQDQNVIVVLPNRASNYAKTMEVKTITDKEASRSLTKMELEENASMEKAKSRLYDFKTTYP